MPEQFVTVATYSRPEEAHLAQNSLFAEGINAFLLDEDVVVADWRLGPALGGIKLQVHQEDAEQALSILGEIADRVKPREKKAPTDEEKAMLAYRMAGFGLMLPPLQLYSMWIMLRLLLRSKSLSKAIRRRLLFAGVLNLWIFVFVTALIVVYFGS